MPIYGLRATVEARKLLRGDPLAKLSFKRVLLLSQVPSDAWLTFDQVKEKLAKLQVDTVNDELVKLLDSHSYINELFWLSRRPVPLVEFAYYKARDNSLHPYKPIGMIFKEPKS